MDKGLAISPKGLLTGRVVPGLENVKATDWNALSDGAYPFLRHEFLSALEACGCLSPDIGWVPHHFLFENTEGQLVGACPTYLKFNSFGEFVFDWAFADAYQRAGLDYYPKLVVAAPFTPATGPRLLLAPEARNPHMVNEALSLAMQMGETSSVSSMHWLFADDEILHETPELMKRVGYQFHWHNRNYADFDDFLAQLTSKRRKEIQRERRQVKDAGIELRRLSGSEVDPKDWRVIHSLYAATFARYGNYPALSEEFFRQIAHTMGESIMIVEALRGSTIIGVAYFLVGKNVLYGRYWGCLEDLPGLHFEACYYQGIEYAIETNLQSFEPGAQGEHKLNRGFLPSRTWSMHWIKDPGFRTAIGHFLQREKLAVDQHFTELTAHSPYKSSF